MATTYEEARGIVAAFFAPQWQYGTFVTEANGFEDDDAWLVPYGTKEAVEDGDLSSVVLDQPIALVEKSTDDLLLVDYLAHADRINAMKPIRG